MIMSKMISCNKLTVRQGRLEQRQDLHFLRTEGHRKCRFRTRLTSEYGRDLCCIPTRRRGRLLELIHHIHLWCYNNAGKEKMTEAKKKLKILLRPGESEKRPDLAWPKSFKKEPVEVVAVCKPSLA
jgi:hypothetical protein